jgi:hypothetical protein
MDTPAITSVPVQKNWILLATVLWHRLNCSDSLSKSDQLFFGGNSAILICRAKAYLGHANIRNTTTYTALAPDRFARFWQN